MATIVFDFDSTLIRVEILDVILAGRLVDPALREELGRLNREGMEGTRTFASSLSARLRLARPTREEMTSFGEDAWQYLTDGMEQLVRELRTVGHEVWIVSGAAREVVLPLAERLGVPPERVRALEYRWGERGELLGIAEGDPLLEGKWLAVEDVAEGWTRPRIAVGDGITDFALREHGCVELFVAYAEHARRDPVLQRCDRSAACTAELRALLEGVC